jgi:hypothetical protein
MQMICHFRRHGLPWATISVATAIMLIASRSYAEEQPTASADSPKRLPASISLPTPLVSTIVSYLERQPYADVAQIMAQMQVALSHQQTDCKSKAATEQK